MVPDGASYQPQSVTVFTIGTMVGPAVGAVVGARVGGALGPGVGAVVGGALVGSAVSMRVVEYNGVMHAAPPTYRASPELCLYAPYPVVCNRPNDERLILRKILEPLERE